DARIASGSTVELPQNLPPLRPSCEQEQRSPSRRTPPVFSLASSLVFVGDQRAERGTDDVGPERKIVPFFRSLPVNEHKRARAGVELSGVSKLARTRAGKRDRGAARPGWGLRTGFVRPGQPG